MIIAKIAGNVVCTQKDQSLIGKKMLIVQPIDISDMTEKGQKFVALDAVGVGIDEIVLVVGGSSARLADDFSKVVVDQSIVGVVDSIELKGTTIFKKT